MKFTRIDMRKYLYDKATENRLVYHLYKMHSEDKAEVVYKRVNGELRALRIFDTDVIRKALEGKESKHKKLLLNLMDEIEGGKKNDLR